MCWFCFEFPVSLKNHLHLLGFPSFHDAICCLEHLSQIESQCNVQVSNQRLTFRSPQGPITLSVDNAALTSLGIVNGELLYLDSPETGLTDKEKQEALKEAEVAAVAHSGDRAGSRRPATGFPGLDVKEDEIDVITHQLDGWVKRARSTMCNHPQQGQCSHCMAIAPWNVQNHEDFSELNLKHVSFHAWLREKEYHSPNNPVYLEDPTWRVDNANQITARQAAFSVVLERQPYRHVDHIEFEDPKMLDNFIGAWRATGKQRAGYLFGKYIREPSGIPLGIAAQVCAIYEPPQRGTAEDVVLLKDQNEAMVDEIASSMGLVRIGFVWTALRVDQNRKIIPDRDPMNYVLTSNECIRMCGLQNKYPSPCKQSNSGKFGSKFVSVLVYGNHDGDIEIAAYQMSNQVARLVRDGVARATKKEPGLLRVRPSTDETLFPDVYYSHRNEYNLLVQSRADPTFPNEYAVVSVRHSFPKDPIPLFKNVSFAIENRAPSLPNAGQVQSALQGKAGSAYMGALSDFHLLLYLSLQMPELAPSLAKLITSPSDIKESLIKPQIEAWVKRTLPSFASSSSPSSSAPSSSSSSSSSKPAAPSATLSAKGQDIVKQIVGMGYTEKQATEAVWATGTAGLEQALSFLLEG
jgi:nuclear protein localization family protein 4